MKYFPRYQCTDIEMLKLNQIMNIGNRDIFIFYFRESTINGWNLIDHIMRVFQD